MTDAPGLDLKEPAYQRVFRRPRPRWLNIPAHRPFVEDLAKGLVDMLAPIGPEALSDAIVLTPTRRGGRSLTEAFVRAAEGRATLLPQIRALGDLEDGEAPFEPGDLAADLPPAISPLRRRFELARLIVDHADLLERKTITLRDALDLADSLGGFLDSLQIEEVRPPEKLEALVQGDLAAHWAASARFLAIATDLWPARLAELGLVDANVRRTQLLRRLAEQWRRNPPDRVLIAAGSTGTAPATADLLAVIAAAPQGAVVLPGLDQDLDDKAWEQVGEAHPQGALKRLIERAGVTRADVAPWPCGETPVEALRGRSRRRVINEALRPAEATSDWLRQIAQMASEGAADGEGLIAEGLQGVTLISAQDEVEAADLAALALREVLETPNATAALVTPDAGLARRVSSVLTRWGVEADNSAGHPLSARPVGVLIGLVARIAADPFNPVLMLALAKHRFARLGYPDLALAGRIKIIEHRALRGVRPQSREQLLTRLEKEPEAQPVAIRLMDCIATAAKPFEAGPIPVPQAMRAIAESMEQLALDERGAPGVLWAGADGESAASLIASVLSDAEQLPETDASGFAALIERLTADVVVRSGGATHGRLRILGAMEARLVRADRLILAGLEEGVWPQAARLDPFLSRSMRADLKLPPPERRIGLSAHDFAQAACAPEAILITSARREGQPAVKSRWLWRLETLAKGAGLSIEAGAERRAWRTRLDEPLHPPPPDLRPAERPAPRPPVSVRPRKLPVTAVETWVRDPYAVYARYILNLRPMDRPDQPLDNRTRGSAIHRAAETFAKSWPITSVAPEDAFFSAYMQELKVAGASSSEEVREAALARGAGVFMARLERERRANGAHVLVEQSGQMTIPAPGGAFHVTARADRIEAANGGAHILDIKTGAPPSRKEVAAGFAPQLTLTAAIVGAGGFADLGATTPDQLVYVRLTGRPDTDDVFEIGKGETPALAEAALSGLTRLVARYDDPSTTYASRIAVKFLTKPSDYDHLARLAEWSQVGADGDEG